MMTALPNWVAGSRRPTMSITWLREGTTTPEVLTGATMTGFIGPASGVGAATAITGILTVTDGAAGVFTWDLSAADVATAGNLKVQFVATFGSDPTPAKTFQADWRVEKGLAVA